MYIRRATEQDASRIAEILVYNNRLNYWPIFQDEKYSFGELQVLTVAEDYLCDRQKREHTFVYDDGVVKGLVQVEAEEIQKLYVDPFFQSKGIGAALIDYAVTEKQARFLWALEKNAGAIRFYQRHGFQLTQDRMPEDGTTEDLIRLER